MNLLIYIHHFNTGSKQKFLILQAKSKVCDLKEISMHLHCCGYDILVIPSISSYSCLQTFVTDLGIPMLVSLDLNFCSVPYEKVIGISLFISSERSQVEYNIIDGAHLEVKAMNFSQENVDWCCGKELSFDKITNGFAFVPGRNRVFEMSNDDSGYHLVPGTVVCFFQIV